MNSLETLKGKLANRFAVIGLGYFGLPVSLWFAEVGFKVIVFDIDPAKTGATNQTAKAIVKL